MLLVVISFMKEINPSSRLGSHWGEGLGIRIYVGWSGKDLEERRLRCHGNDENRELGKEYSRQGNSKSKSHVVGLI